MFTATDDVATARLPRRQSQEDTTAPELTVPADYTSECSDDLILDDASATDNCGEVTIEESSETILAMRAGNYTVVRTVHGNGDAATARLPRR